MLIQIQNKLESTPRVLSAGLVVFLFTGLIVLDRIADSEFTFYTFYIVPLYIGAWYVNRSFTIVIALCEGGLRYFLNLYLEIYQPDDIQHYWNLGVRLSYYMIIIYLISSIRQRFDTEMRFAYTDSHTGLLNPRGLYKELGKIIGIGKVKKTELTVAFLDLDNFKTVNDKYGHAIGDKVLVQIANILKTSIREKDILARLGGDEFVLILNGLGADGARSTLESIRLRLNERIKDIQVDIGVSIGAIVYPNTLFDAKEMINEADRLMYDVKKNGKNRVKIKNWTQQTVN